MQANECSRAISFANGYFALVDGLAYGLEDHLTEDVMLEWFGRVVRGRKNVAAFMRTHMANSRHIFSEIMPTANIDSRTCDLTRDKYQSEKELSFASLCIEDEASNEKDEMNLELNDGSLKYLLSEENFAHSSENAIKTELINQDDVEDVESMIYDNGLIKFVKAKGIVQLDRRSARNKIRKWESSGFGSGNNVHNWRRRCTLKLAYSINFDSLIESEMNLEKSNIYAAVKSASLPMNYELNIKREIANASQGRKRSKSSDDIFESIAGLGASNLNSFVDFDSLDDRQKFLEFFEAEIAAGDSKFDLTTPKYVGDRLVFDWSGKINPEGGEYPKGFKFDYSIHTIIYECNMECKLNLSQEFEKQEILGETEKRV